MNQDQINQPANLGEVNLTLKFMQQTQKENSIATKDTLKEINQKLDGLTNTFVTSHEHEELKKLVTAQEITIKTLVEFKDTLIGKMWGIGVLAATISSIASLFISHYWK